MAIEGHQRSAASAFQPRFRIVHSLYAAALISSAVATFETGGIVLACVFCAAWGWVFASKSRPRAFPAACLVLLLSGCLYGLLAPAFTAARERIGRMRCPNHLKQITLALHAYDEVYHSFPPAYIADEHGRPMHSWRVLILPFIEEQPRYAAYRFDEPWDGPHNSKLLTPMPVVYACPSRQVDAAHGDTHASYLAVVGVDTPWPGQTATRIGDIRDGLSQTLLVCEVTDRDISWMEPADVSIAEAIELLSSTDPHQQSGHSTWSFFYERNLGRNVALADGSVKYFGHGMSEQDARRLLTLNDGVPLDVDAIQAAGVDTRRLRIGNCIRLGVFVLLAIWPLPWVWINPHGARGVPDSDRELPSEKP